MDIVIAPAVSLAAWRSSAFGSFDRTRQSLDFAEMKKGPLSTCQCKTNFFRFENENFLH